MEGHCVLKIIEKVLVLSQLGHLTLDCVENFSKKSHLLKKLAFSEVYRLGLNYHVTLFLSGQMLIKNAQNGPFWLLLKKLKFAVKQCYQTGQF